MTPYLPNSPRARGESAALSEPQQRTRVRRLTERTTLAPAPRVLSFAQSQLAAHWNEAREGMNAAAADNQFTEADKYLAIMREIESALGFRPTATTESEVKS